MKITCSNEEVAGLLKTILKQNMGIEAEKIQFSAQGIEIETKLTVITEAPKPVEDEGIISAVTNTVSGLFTSNNK